MRVLDAVTHRRFKDELYREFARIGQALASPRRLEMLDLLAQRERSVEDLAQEMGLSVANCSQHLRILAQARLVETRREGTRVYYRLAGDEVFRLWQAVRETGERRLAEITALVRRYLGERDELEAVDADELLRRVRAGEVILLDVRPLEEYRAGHVPGARPVPPERLEEILHTLPRDREIVAYCRGPYCVFSDEAVAILRAAGVNAHRLRLGLPDWRMLGLPVVEGDEQGELEHPAPAGWQRSEVRKGGEDASGGAAESAGAW
jgi:rhodanese-related sulfurtransferase/predicted transcriptional regulator